MDGEIVLIDDGLNDRLLAKQAREDLGKKLREICEVMDRYRVDGLLLNFALGVDANGKMIVADISVLKQL